MIPRGPDRAPSSWPHLMAPKVPRPGPRNSASHLTAELNLVDVDDGFLVTLMAIGQSSPPGRSKSSPFRCCHWRRSATHGYHPLWHASRVLELISPMLERGAVAGRGAER